MEDVRRGDLVAATMPPGPDWGPFIARAWDAQAAVLPVDHRLTDAERAALIGRARATAVFDGSTLLLRDGDPVADGVALAMATSGTSGEQRVAELTHDALRAATEASARRLGAAGDDPWLCCLPLAHIGGMLVLLRSLIGGAPVEVHGRFGIEAFERSQASFVSLVPTMLQRLLDARADLDRFDAIVVGGASLTPGLSQRARNAGARIVSTYGLTESCGGVVYDGAPLDGVEVTIDGGEISLRGPMLMRGYRGATPLDGWLRTGDAGRFVDGILHVDGRLDDSITTGGETVWPREVEAVLGEHPHVASVAVIGRPDDTWGARVTAFVVPAGAAPSLEDLRAFGAAHLARFKLPHELVIVQELPHTPSGKIARAALR